jgi:hypothetical protein
VIGVSRKGVEEGRCRGVLAIARIMRRRTVAAGGRDCSLASRRSAVATGLFASRQIARYST